MQYWIELNFRNQAKFCWLKIILVQNKEQDFAGGGKF